MSENSKIEWTDSTWNPVTGCTKLSQGCKNCYAERVMKWIAPGQRFTELQLHPERLLQPLHWTQPRKIFVNSLSDLFHESIPQEFIDAVFAVMALSPQHIFQVLTKRPEQMRSYFSHDAKMLLFRWYQAASELPISEKNYSALVGPFRTIAGKLADAALSNVWLGVSCEDQKTADERIPILLKTPAAIRFVSCEPLLGPIDLSSALEEHYFCPDCGDGQGFVDEHCKCGGRYLATNSLDWVIAGGESGPAARPTHPDWVRSLRHQRKYASVPFFFKQWGEWLPSAFHTSYSAAKTYLFDDGQLMMKVGKKHAGRLLDGILWDQYPETPCAK